MDYSKRALLLTAILGLAGLVFLADLFTSLGILVWGLYLLLILASAWLENPRYTLLTAAVCAVFTVVGISLSPPSVPLGWGSAVEILSLVGIGLAALVGLTVGRWKAQLAEITERKQAQDALRQSEQRERARAAELEAVMEITPVAINIAHDRKCHRITGNRAAMELLRLPLGVNASKTATPAERALQPYRIVRNGVEIPVHELPMQVAAARGVEVRGAELDLEFADGSVRHILGNTVPLRGPDGEVQGAVGVFLDITENKQAAELLQNREARLRAVLDAALDAIVTIDERGIIESVNPATERLFGYAAHELIGQKVNLLMPSPYREEHDGYLEQYLRTNVKRIIGIGREVQGQRKDGSLFPAELSVSEGHVGQRWFTGTIRDISRRRELEQEVLEVATLEQQRIGRELHDGVGQELTGLGLLADALARRLEKSSPSEQRLAGDLVQGLQRVHQQVRTLCRGLILAEPDAEALRVALDDLAASIAEQSGIACTLDCAEPAPVPDPVTAKHLYRIAQEAVSNALRHGRPKQIALSLRSGPEGLCLTIRDDGIGVQELVESHQGLGIPTMRYRAGMIGGALQVGRGEGGGTLVTCTVPRRRGHAGTEPKHRESSGENPRR
jgi:PAS domain S-box-containing protein